MAKLVRYAGIGGDRDWMTWRLTPVTALVTSTEVERLMYIAQEVSQEP